MGALRRQNYALIASPEWARIGTFVVNIPLREVQRPGRTGVRVTPKAMGVLLALIEANGRPVSRDALLERVWPNTLPTGDVVTQAIVQLRKALVHETPAPYIATINRSGYRLTVSAALFETASFADLAPQSERTSPPIEPVPAIGTRHSLLVGLVIALLLAAITCATILSRL